MQNKNLQHPATDQQVEAAKQAEFKALADRVAQLEKQVAALKGKN